MKNNKGFAIVTALGLLMILMIIVAVVSATSVAESKQGQLSIELAQARAIADAGDTYASSNISSVAGQNAIGSTLTSFINPNVDPQAQWSISPSSWSSIAPQLEQTLNANFNTLSPENLDNLGTANITYQIRNFRGTQRNPNSQIFMADYTVVSTGTTNSEKAIRKVENRGVLEIKLGYNALNQYLFLVDDAGGNSGFYSTGSVFNGPVHANRNWGFWGHPVFLGKVTTAANCAIYWDFRRRPRKACLDANARPPRTVPVFNQGFQRGVPPVALPTASVSEAKAALGMNLATLGQPTAAQTCNALGLGCTNSVPDGVYLKNDGTRITGGIYVEGDVDELIMSGAGRNGIQTYSFKQDGDTTIITLDYNNNRTRISPPGTWYDGTPNGTIVDPNNNGPNGQPTGANGQIYVNGKIKSVRAPTRTGSVNPPDGNAGNHPPSANIPPALAKETQLNITATGKIELRSDIVYECDPTMVNNAGYLAQFPRCAVPNNTMLPTVLGMTSLQNNIEITTDMPNNPYLWGSYLAGQNNRGLTVENWSRRPAQGTMRVFGGLLQNLDQLRGRLSRGRLVNGFYENYDFDARFTNGQLSPPNFPRGGQFQYLETNPTQLSYKEY